MKTSVLVAMNQHNVRSTPALKDSPPTKYCTVYSERNKRYAVINWDSSVSSTPQANPIPTAAAASPNVSMAFKCAAWALRIKPASLVLPSLSLVIPLLQQQDLSQKVREVSQDPDHRDGVDWVDEGGDGVECEADVERVKAEHCCEGLVFRKDCVGA